MDSVNIFPPRWEGCRSDARNERDDVQGPPFAWPDGSAGAAASTVYLNSGVDSVLIAKLKSDLSTARYTVERLPALWGDQAEAALSRGQRIPALRALRSAPRPDPAATLATLFVLGMPVPVVELERSLPVLGVDGAIALGLVEQRAGVVGPLIDLRPYSFIDDRGAGSWWIASDLGELSTGEPLREDHVLGVGGASMTLTGLMIGNPVDTVLDLGTGCGIQALHASRHAGRVIATDISERALELAAFNAELNGITTIEFRHGSLFEPVAGERVSQMVSNPPFVITPRTAGVPAYEYRDGGMIGDALVAGVIRDAAEHLATGGIAQLLGNWEYRHGEDGLDRVAGWLDGTGLDAWVIERDVQDVAGYAETWIRDGGTRHGTPEFDRLYEAWLDDFEARGVEKVGFGYLLLRRPAPGDPAFRRMERLHGALGSNAAGLGAHLAACLSSHDWQARLSDQSLALATLTVASDVTEERHYWPGEEHPTVITLRQGGGFGRTIAADTALAALVGACDGELSVRAISAALAELLEADDSALLGQLLPSIRELLDTGILLPPGGGTR
ncbi:MAG: SAM-dependent methyltransferase [Microbacteriaceae bacterium]|nr:SAM-dependent methyltransferase [Microbacteriaceae bacterium]